MAAQVPLGNINDLLSIVKAERNDFSLDSLAELQAEQPGSFDDNMSLRVGSRVFKNFKPVDLYKIERAYQNYSIVDRSGGAAAEAAVVVFRNIKSMTDRHIITGEHDRSIAIFARGVGGVDIETNIQRVINGDYPSRPVFSIISDTAYSNKLETMAHHGARQGFLYHASQMAKREFGKAVDIKFDFLANSRLIGSAKGGSMPRVQIGNPGDVRGRSIKPGTSKPRKRRKRRK